MLEIDFWLTNIFLLDPTNISIINTESTTEITGMINVTTRLITPTITTTGLTIGTAEDHSTPSNSSLNILSSDICSIVQSVNVTYGTDTTTAPCKLRLSVSNDLSILRNRSICYSFTGILAVNISGCNFTEHSSYKISTGVADFTSAQACCRSINMTLIELSSARKEVRIQNIIMYTEKSFYIGIDGRDVSSTNYTQWLSGKPVTYNN